MEYRIPKEEELKEGMWVEMNTHTFTGFIIIDLSDPNPDPEEFKRQFDAAPKYQHWSKIKIVSQGEYDNNLMFGSDNLRTLKMAKETLKNNKLRIKI